MIDPPQMIDWINGKIKSTETWLGDFSEGKRKRPDHEISQKRKDIEHFEEIKRAYLRALDRKQSMEN